MLINADETVRALVHADALPWVPSPQGEVDRRMLARIGDEVALATTIVRYPKGAVFPSHTHELGEEYLVLDGVFQDETCDHPAGRYVRNPPGSQHTPRAQNGAVIFVKLRDFDPADRRFVNLDIDSVEPHSDRQRPGVQVRDLHTDARETVSAETWTRDQRWQESFPHGAELLVLQGHLTESGDALRAWSWLRLPAGASVDAQVTSDTATVWIKRHRVPRPVRTP